MEKIIVLLFIALVFFAYHKPQPDPYNMLIPQGEAAWQEGLLPEIAKISEPDRKLLAEYLARAKQGAKWRQTGVPPNMSVAGAIAAQKKFNDDAIKQAQKERLAKVQAELLKNPGDAIGIKVTDIRVVSDKYLPAYKKLVCQLVVENIGMRNISGVKGRVYFYDGAGREMAQLALNLRKRIDAGSVIKTTWTQDYNQYSDADRDLARLTNGEYRTVFIPEVFVYTNGKKLVLLMD